jgi:hypothetical protein
VEADVAEDLLISAIPSSGSDWFASCISKASTHSYYREFFNPICNWPLADDLGTVFGCESAKYAHNIARRTPAGDREVDEIIEALWKPSGYTMTKEVWVTEKLEALSKHFRVICFSRTPERSMPPNRARVVGWMHTYAAQAGIQGGFAMSAMRAYSTMHGASVLASASIGAPLILWDELIVAEKSQIKDILDRAEMPGVDCSLAAEIIVETRRDEPRRTLEGWSHE